MILVLSGTKDGRTIINRLIQENHKVLGTTATEYGGNLIDSHPNLLVISKPLDRVNMEETIKKNKVRLIIDATHPYAKEVSKNAIDCSDKIGIPYIRYEREQGSYEDIISTSSFYGAVELLKEKKGNILLTIGSNHLDEFSNSLDMDRLFVRVLPTPSVMEKCRNLGFLPKQIIGIQGPFSKEFNRVILNDYNIKHMVTKDSGDIGGTREKIEAAQEKGVEVIIVERPRVEYGKVFSDIKELIEYVNNVKTGL